MVRTIYDFLASLNLGFWLMGGVMLVMAVGSFLTGEASGINDVALLHWLRQVPFGMSWWLWLVIALLALLVLNTIICSVEALRTRYGKAKLLHLLAPQAMHLGFLFITLAHLLSAQGGMKDGGQVREGMAVTLPDGSSLRFDRITGQVGPFGMATDYRADITHTTAGTSRSTSISPNHPFFHGDYGIYLKHAELAPVPFGIVELHREPGAGAALAGALLFTAGNVVLLAIRRGRAD